MLRTICTLVQKRINIDLYNKLSLVRIPDKIAATSPDSGYQKTSSSLKHKERDGFRKLSQEEIQQRDWYLKNPQIPVKESEKYLFEEHFV